MSLLFLSCNKSAVKFCHPYSAKCYIFFIVKKYTNSVCDEISDLFTWKFQVSSFTWINPVANTVGHYLLSDPSFMFTFQVCRVLKAYYHSSKESTRAASVVSPEFRIEEALGSCLLPSLQLIPANPAVDMEIWGVLSLLTYEVCHIIYIFAALLMF